MSKTKRSCLGMIKSFFFPQLHHHQQQKSKSRRWHFPFPSLKGSPPPPPPPPAALQCNVKEDVVMLDDQQEDSVQSLAVVKIQALYRAYLARKAWRALKGFVKLQATIRGQLVRRQAVTTLKSLEAIVSIQSEVCTKRGQMAVDKYKNIRFDALHHHILEMEINKHTRIDDGLLPKQEEIDNILRKREAILRRQMPKPYSSNQKIFTDSPESRKAEGKLRYWLKKYANDQVLTTKDSKTGLKHLKLKRTQSLNNLSLTRRSFDHTGLNPRRSHTPGTTPTYMEPTKSARAKARSTSTPRPRSILVNRAYSDGVYSPYKHRLSLRLSPMSSTRSDMTCSGFGNKCFSNCEHKSPSIKGISRLALSNKN